MQKAAVLYTKERSTHAPICGGVLPLAMASYGTPGKICAIRGKDDTKRFLNNLGFVEGAQVSVVNSMGGDMIVDVKGTRVALSRQMAQRIILE